MAYTPATIFPELAFFQWGTVDAPNPALSAPLAPDDTTAYFTSAPLDHNGDIVTPPFLMGIRNRDSYVMTCYVSAIAADGLSATIVQGIRLEGLDWTTSDPDLIPSAGFSAGDAVSCNISGVIQALTVAAFQGTIATNGLGFIIGDGTDSNVTISQKDATSTKGFLRKNPSTGKVQYSNDGVAWVNIDSVSASNLVTVSATDTTPGYLGVKVVGDGTTTSTTILNAGGNEEVQFTANGDLADIIADVSATSNEIDQALDGISASVTAANLNTLTAGPASSADALHSHSTPALSGMAYEAISQYDAVASLPIEMQFYTGMTEVDSTLGNANSSRRFAMKVVPSRTVTDLTAVLFRAKEAVNGATVGNMSFSIETDNAGAPSGSAVSNGTASFTQATLRTWTNTYATRTATLAGAVSLTKGTTYWFVWAMDATDAANYIKMGDASSYDENYLTFTRLTYNVDTATWGSSSTVLPLFFWTTPSVSLGSALCKTDADWPVRMFKFVGFATAAASANAACSYYYDSVPGLTVVPGSEYFISDTAGAITTTATGNGYKIGYAFVDSTGAKLLKISLGRKLSSFSNSVSSSTTQNIDTFHLTGFKLNGGDINYYLTGEASGAAKYTIAHAALYGAGILGNGPTYIYDAAAGNVTTSTMNAYTSYTTQPGGAGANLAVTISIRDITENSFVVRHAFTAGSSPASRTSSYGGVAIG